jgi:RNA 3'-terminal phosphate cyclase (ATP)
MFLQIDGSHGEGRGQILRTSLSLSSLLKRLIEINHIRRGRKVFGLQPQHLTAVNACAIISNAWVEGNNLQSLSLKFSPREVVPGDYYFDVAEEKSSAGSVSLVLQTLLLPLSSAERASTLRISGGTHVPFSPPFTYLQEVFAPMLLGLGLRTNFEIKKWGFYPLGGGEVFCQIYPVEKLNPLNLEKRGELKKLSGISAVANLPLTIAERQRDKAIKTLQSSGFSPEIEIIQVPSKGKGTFFFLLAEFENSPAGFSSLGEMGKKAEIVAEEACQDFLNFISTQATVEKHLADQLIPYLALAQGESFFTVSSISQHLLTNIWVVQKFLPVSVTIRGELGKVGELIVKPLLKSK